MIALVAGCTSESGTKTLSTDGGGGLNDLNALASGSLFDSIQKLPLPFTDTLSVDEALPVFAKPLRATQLDFLQLPALRVFRDDIRPLKATDFSMVGRLPLSPDFFAVIIHRRAEAESMNYLITYDRNFQVVDYLMTAYAEDMDAAPRLSCLIDSTGLTVTSYNPADRNDNTQAFTYSLSGDGFFREVQPAVASK